MVSKEMILRATIFMVLLLLLPFRFLMRRGRIAEQPKDFVYDID